jgi:hypothetical protein
VIVAILADSLPADDDRRTFYVVYTAYLALSLTDPALAIAPLVKNSEAVPGVIAAQLGAAQAAGDTPTHLDPDLEAFSLMAMSAGLATSVLVGQSSIQQAHESTSHPPPGNARHSPARRCRRHHRRTGGRALPAFPPEGRNGRKTGRYTGPGPGSSTNPYSHNGLRAEFLDRRFVAVLVAVGSIAEPQARVS